MEVWRHISAGPPVRAVRREPARHRPVHPDARLAPGRAARPRRRSRRRPAPCSTPTRRGQRLARRPPRLARVSPSVGRRASTRPSRGRPRHAGLGQGPGLEPRRQLRLRGLPATSPTPRLGDPARTDELFPAYRDGRAGDHADRPGRIRRGRRGRPARRRGGRRAGAAPRTRRPRLDARAGGRLARRSPASAIGLLALAGLDAADGLASRPRDRLEQLGRRRRGVARRGGALLANDPHLGISMPSIWFMNGLHCRTGRRRPARTTSPASRSRASPASSSATTRGSRGAPRTSTPTSRTCSSRRSTRPIPDALPRTMASPSRSRSATRDQGHGRRRRSTSRSARPSTGRSSTASTTAWPTRRRWPCAGRRPPSRTARSTRSSGSTSRPNFEDFRASLSLLRRAGAELRLCRRRRPHRLPAPGLHPDPRPTPTTAAIARSVATTAAANGRAGSRSRTCPGSSIRETAGSSRANNAAVDADYPYFVGPGVGSRATAPSGSSTCSTPYGEDGLTVDGARRDPDRQLAAPRRATSSPLLAAATPATADGADDRARGSPAGTAPATIDSIGLRRLERLGVPGHARRLRRRARAASPATTSAARLVGGAGRAARRPGVGRGGTT